MTLENNPNEPPVRAGDSIRPNEAEESPITRPYRVEDTGPITAADAIDMVLRFSNSHFDKAAHRPGREHARISVPTDPRRDDDIRLIAFIKQSAARIKEMEQGMNTKYWEGIRAENVRLMDRLHSLDCVQKAELLESFRAIGREIGCDHTDDADGRAKLVRCVRETIGELKEKLTKAEYTTGEMYKGVEAAVAIGRDVIKDRNSLRSTLKTSLKACLDNCEKLEKENARLSLVVKDFGEQIIAARDAKESSAKAAGGAMAWMVWEPKGSEFDSRIFPTIEDAREYAAKLDDDRESDAEPIPHPVPLFAIETIGLMEAARDEAEKERDQLAANIGGLNASREMLTKALAAERKERDALLEQSTEWRNVMKHVAEMPGKDWLKGQLILATFLNPKGAGKDLLAELTAIMTSPSPSPCPTCEAEKSRADAAVRAAEQVRAALNERFGEIRVLRGALCFYARKDFYERQNTPRGLVSCIDYDGGDNARQALATPAPENPTPRMPETEEEVAAAECAKCKDAREVIVSLYRAADTVIEKATLGTGGTLLIHVDVFNALHDAVIQTPIQDYGIADTSPDLPSEVHPIESRKMGEATNGRPLLPKLENSVYKYPDGSAVYKLPRTGAWVAHWADRTPLRGCEGEIETASYFNTPEDAAKALLAGGEGPASMTDSPPPASPSKENPVREGDAILHKPSGETWSVAGVYESGGEGK